MTRRKSKKLFRSDRISLRLPSELKPYERQVRKYLDSVGDLPDIPEGCIVISTPHPAIAEEYNRRWTEMLNRDPLNRAYEEMMQLRNEQQR